MDRDSGVSVRFGLDPNPEIAAKFPHPFHLTYVVTLTKHELSTDIHVVNPDPKKTLTGAIAAAADTVVSALPESVTGTEQKTPQSVDEAAASHDLKFQALFHTYLHVDDASKVKIKGLKQGLTYLDKVGGPWTERKWDGGDLVIDKQVDR